MLTFFYCVGRALRSRDRGSAVACRASQTGNLCLCCLRCLFICEASSHTHQPVSATIVQKEEGERESVLCCCVYARREETPAHVVQLKLEERKLIDISQHVQIHAVEREKSASQNVFISRKRSSDEGSTLSPSATLSSFLHRSNERSTKCQILI